MTRERLLWLLPLRAAVLGALAGAAVVGVVLVLIRLSRPDPASFADLGYAVAGLVLGVAVAVGVWLGGLVRAAVRLFERGSRLGVLTAAVAAVFVLAIGASLASAQLAQAALPPWASVTLTVVTVAVVLAAPSVVFALWPRARRRAPDGSVP